MTSHHHDILFRGQSARVLRLAGGDQLTLAAQGAQVLSWVAGGRERLYLSPRAVFDGRSAIRGGVPVCFPQFNERAPATITPRLPKHGFARNLAWTLDPPEGDGEALTQTLTLRAGINTWPAWPYPFTARLIIALRPGECQLTLAVTNSGPLPLPFTGALHSYFAVDDATQARLSGLEGAPEWDTVADTQARAAAEQRFGDEFDRVYTRGGSEAPLELREGGHRLAITQSASWAQSVVWNPGPARCAQLSDMPPDGWRAMLCVEAAQVLAPLRVEVGQTWTGWQRWQAQG